MKVSMIKEKIKPGGPKKHIVVSILFLLIIILSSLYYYFILDEKYIGQIESNVVPAISEVSGKIISSPISLGEPVKSGDIIAIIDSKNHEYILEQLELNLEKTMIALGEASIESGGSASNSYVSALASYDAAYAASIKSSKDYSDAKMLFEEGGISERELENYRLLNIQANSLAATSLSRLNEASSQSGENFSKIDISLLQSQIKNAQETLEKYTIKASVDGTIISKNYNEGSLISYGYNIADIGSTEEKYVVFYVPEKVINKLDYNMDIIIKEDASKVICKIKYIDLMAQYTPKDLQTEANKSKTSFKVKALLPQESSLKPGVKVNVLI